MDTNPWRTVARFAAVLVGVGLPLFTLGVVEADLPGGVPTVTPPGVPQVGQVIKLGGAVSNTVLSAAPGQTSCVWYTSYDNTQTTPPGTIFRGQDACGSGVYQPTMSGQVFLSDAFGNRVAAGAPFGPVTGSGPFTSQGTYTLPGNIGGGVTGVGPVPGLPYTLTFDTTFTFTAPQYPGPPGPGCTVSGQSEHCIVTLTYNYIPGTQGGIVPS
jgi:hypothetical protein